MNGWSNYETWNVALWIQNDEGLYEFAKDYKRALHPYGDLIYSLLECGVKETPDGIPYSHPNIDRDEINEMIAEL